MLKKLLIAAVSFAVLLMVALAFITARYIDHAEILRAKSERDHLRAVRDSIAAVVAVKDSIQKELELQVTGLQTEANILRQEVDSLENLRRREQLKVRLLRKKEDLQDKFMQTFPEIAYSDWGVTEVYNEAEQISIQYLMVPLWFAETFIIDHQNSLSYQKQKDKLLLVDSLQTAIVQVKDSLRILEMEKGLAYKKGYDEAYAKYEDINKRYIKLLQKPPQVKIGFPGWGTVLGATAAGVVVGTQLQWK